MPVLIVGAASPLGRAVCTAFLATGGQVRAYVPVPDPELQAAGVHVAVGDWLDVPRLESALTQVHTLVHLTGPSVRHARDEAEALEVSAISAHAADVPRVVVLLHEGHPRKQQRGIEAGMAFFDGTDCEAILVRAPADAADVEVLDALIAADARA